MTTPNEPAALPHELEEIAVDTRPIAIILLSRSVRPFLLIAGVLAFVLVMQAPAPAGLTPVGQRALAVFTIASIYWITGALPLMVTSLLVLVLLGIAGAMPARAAYAAFGNEALFFVLAAFMLAAAVNRRGLGLRIALRIFARFGRTPRGMLMSVYLLSSLMSFVIPEHAVAAMVFPIVLDLVRTMELRPNSRYASALFLAMAWGTNIGGIATLLGGARAALALGIMTEATGRTISFLNWSMATAPLVAVLLVIGYMTLAAYFPPDETTMGQSVVEIARRAEALGRTPFDQRAVAVILAITVAAWLLGSKQYGLAGIAILAVVALFAFNLLTWREVEEYVNWGIIFMYGGAIALGSALEKSGAAAWLANATLGHATSPYLVLAVLSLFALALGETLSHSAVVAALLPVGLGLSNHFGIDPRIITLAVSLPAGLTFVLPVGTPANALAYSGGYLRTTELVVPGMIVILASWVGINLALRFYWPYIGLGAIG